MKRKTIALLLLLLCVLNVNAQDDNVHTKSVYVEAFGPSNGIGVTYDARFNENSRWGYRVGFGFGYKRTSDIFGKTSVRGYSVPVGVNYLVGGKKHALELGAGLNAGIYNNHDFTFEPWYIETTPGNKKQIGWKTKPIKENKFGMFAYTTVGYRYTSKKGFQFRAGVMPAVAFAFKGIHDHKVVLAPYISFGKAF